MGRVERLESCGVLRMPGKMYTFEFALTREGREYVMIRGTRRRGPAPQLIVPAAHLAALIGRLGEIRRVWGRTAAPLRRGTTIARAAR